MSAGQFIYHCPLPDQYIPMSPPPIWTLNYLLTHTFDGWSQRSDWLLDHRPLCVSCTHPQVSPPPIFERVGGDILLIIGMINRSVCQHVRDGSHYGTPPLPFFQNFTHKIFKNYQSLIFDVGVQIRVWVIK